MRIALPQTGALPFLFNGNRRHEVTGPPLTKFQNRYTLTLYAIDEGGWVVHIAYSSINRYESPAHWIIGGTDAPTVGANLLEWIRTHDPATLLLGFPEGAQFEPGKRKSAARLTAQLGALATDLLPFLTDP